MCDSKEEGGRRCTSSTPEYRREKRAAKKLTGSLMDLTETRAQIDALKAHVKATAAGESLAEAAVATVGTPSSLAVTGEQFREWVHDLDDDARVEAKVHLADGYDGADLTSLRSAARHHVVRELFEGQELEPDQVDALVEGFVGEFLDQFDGRGLTDDDIEHFLDGGDYSPYDSWELDGSRGIEVVKVTNNDWVVHYTGRLTYEGPRFERHEYWDDARAAVKDWAQNAYESVNPRDIAQSFEDSVEAGELDDWYVENAEWACNVKSIIEGRLVDPHEIYDDHWWVGVPGLSFEDKVAWHQLGWDAHTAHLAVRAGVTVESARNYDPKDPATLRAWETLAALRT